MPERKTHQKNDSNYEQSFFLNIKEAADVINAVADRRQPHFQAPPDQYAEPLPFITL